MADLAPGRSEDRSGRCAILAPTFLARPDRPLRILAIGAHCDDIEIGAGGTLLEWTEGDTPVEVAWVVMTSSPERALEARASAEQFVCRAESSTVKIHDFRDGFLPYVGGEVKEAFEALRQEIFDPDVILTHHRDDRHQDHRFLSDLTWNTFRDHLVLEYEIPKYDGDLSQPNWYVPVSDERVSRKWQYLTRYFASQHDKPWFTESTIRGLMRIRGIEARASSGYAEGFTARKVVLGPLTSRPNATSADHASATGQAGPAPSGRTS